MNERLQNRLQERNRPIRSFEATLRWRCEEFFIVRAEACLKTESANRQIKELENKVREADCYGEKVEDSPHCRIKELNKKLQDTNNDRKEVESSVCGKV